MTATRRVAIGTASQGQPWAAPEVRKVSPADHEAAMAETVRLDRLEYDSASDGESEEESEEESDAPEDASDDE